MLRLYPLPLPLPARLLLPQFLLLFLLFLLNPRPPGAERLVGTREAFRIKHSKSMEQSRISALMPTSDAAADRCADVGRDSP